MIINTLLSINLMAIIFIILSTSMTVGTFIEKVYTTETAKSLIYETRWFEILMLILIISIIGNIVIKKEKLPLVIFHFSFILLFIGGAISRYIGFEGLMSIKQGFTSNSIVSSNTFIFIKVYEEKKLIFYKKSYLLSPLHNNFQGKFKLKENFFKVNIIDYIPSSKGIFIENPNGKPFIKIFFGKKNNYLKQGEFKVKNKLSFGNEYVRKICNIFESNGKLFIIPNNKGKYIILSTGKKGFLFKGRPSKIFIKTIYKIGQMQFFIPELCHFGILKYFSLPKSKKNNFLNAFSTKITIDNCTKIITFFCKKKNIEYNNSFFFNKKIISIEYGPIIINIPFFLHLRNFTIKYYPGSYLASSFSSELRVIDGNIEKKYSVFMNNVLDYKEYRFFQSGYNSQGEKSKTTYILVNHDYYGRKITYTGYFFLGIGMFLSMFWRGTRFYKLRYMIFEISKICFSIFPTFIFFSLNAKNNNNIYFEKNLNLNEIIDSSPKIPASHIKKFSNILVQDENGRVRPIHTMALKLLRKIYNNENIGSWNPTRWMLDIYLKPILWLHIPFIKVSFSKQNGRLFKSIPFDGKGFTSLLDIYRFNSKTGDVYFLLQKDYEEAFSKNPSRRNKYEKEIIDFNERIGIISGIFKGQYLRIFPVITDMNNTWISWMQKDFFKVDPIAFNLLNNYFVSVNQAQTDGNWKKADKFIRKIKNFQSYYGWSSIPSKTKIKTEIFFNIYNFNYKIIIAYFLSGILLLLISFLTFFRSYYILRILSNIIIILILLIFFIQTANIAIRWYIAGYSPGSNGYESSLFISWCILLIGLFFFTGKNFFIPSISSLASAFLLKITSVNSMNQDIINLVPVLKSYWLMIHVAVITASYGFFSFGCLLGIIILLLYIFYPFKKKRFSLNRRIKIQELTLINELSITVGLFFIIIGTFLGGIWANESWGRYWSWDPKETWALISIIVYAFILHMRLVTKLNKEFSFNFASIISLSSIIMTYFGVNNYLSGLHSYSKDDPIPLQKEIYYTIVSLFFISVFSKYLYREYYSI